MALIKQYGLSGVHSDVQFGKTNGRIKYDTDHFKVRDLADAAYLRLKAADPTEATDLTTKYYVDSVAQGLQPKEAVAVATNDLSTIDSNVSGGSVAPDMANMTYTNGSDSWHLDTGTTLDEYTLLDGDRVLIKDGTGADAKGNGIFEYTLSSKTFYRSPDADNQANISGTEIGGAVFVFVMNGTVCPNTGWIVSAPTGTATLGTDNITWVQFSRATGIYATDGLAQDGNRLYVRTDGVTIYLDNDDVAVKSSGTAYQILESDGAGGTAAWGALRLNQPNATTNTLLRSRGGLEADVSGFANQSLYLSNLTGNNTTELAKGADHQVLRIDGSSNVGYGALDVSQSTVSVTGTLDETHGGTGESTYTQHDILVGDGGSKLGKVSIGSNYEILSVTGAGALAYGAVALDQAAAVSGTLPESHGGTGEVTYTKGDILHASSTAADGALAKLGIGTDGQILNVSTDVPEWITPNDMSGIVGVRQVAIGTADTNVGAILPTNVRVTSVRINITTPYTGGGVTVTIGDVGDADRLVTVNEVDIVSAGLYQIDLMHNYTSSTQAVAYITSATAGAGYVMLDYVRD